VSAGISDLSLPGFWSLRAFARFGDCFWRPVSASKNSVPGPPLEGDAVLVRDVAWRRRLIRNCLHAGGDLGIMVGELSPDLYGYLKIGRELGIGTSAVQRVIAAG
jgi:hypothetical protein